MRLKFLFGISAAVVSGMLTVSCTKEFDPSYLEQQIADLQQRVKALEDAAASTNSSISALQKVVDALNSNLHIVSVEETKDGTVITFSDGTTTTVGKSQQTNVPTVGVKEISGVYYWTIGGELIKDKNGNPLPVSGKNGTNGTNGTNGKDGQTPVIGVKLDGSTYYWTVNGEYLLDSTGKRVPANYTGSSSSADSVFKSVTVKNGVVTFVLQNGQSFVVPMQAAANLVIESGKLHFKAGEKKNVNISTEGINAMTITEKPEGWKASINGSELTVTAPTGSTGDKSGYVVVLGTSGSQTFIGKLRVTTEAALFTMAVSSNGVMTLTELDTDFNNPGFIAGFVEAENFDPEAIVAPAKAYTPQNGEGIYTSWSSSQTGKKTFDVSIKNCGITPKAGKKYAAYCFPGVYSKNIGVDPDPSDVEVVYFTYSSATVTVSGVTTDRATISASVSGASSFYGGIIRYFSDDEFSSLREEFLIDAEAPLKGIGDGTHGVMMNSYSGALNMFAALDDGDGNKNPRSIVPGGKYVIAIIPKYDGKPYEQYTTSDVVLEKVVLQTPKQTSSVLATVKAGSNTTTSSSAIFGITSNVSKFYYTVVPSADLKASSLSDYDYATRYGVIFDRAILKTSGPVEGMDLSCTGIKPGQECTAIGVAFTSAGDYYIAKMTVKAAEVLLSSGTLAINSHSLETIGANSTKVTINYTASSQIKTIRYMNMTKAEFTSQYGSKTDTVYDLLTAGHRWDYDEISSSDKLELYIYPEKVDYIIFAVGVDSEGKFTKIAQHTYQPVK